MDNLVQRLPEALLVLSFFIVSLTLHEWGHAAMADKLGDPTPRSQGRVSFNPLRHIDWLGTVAIPLLGILGVFGGFAMIGWAKPVMINPSYFKNPKNDSSWVTIAGPGMNLVQAVACAILASLLHHHPASGSLLWYFVQINIGLMLFNLLPIPPLDGSKFLMYWFGMSAETYNQFARFGMFILIGLFNLTPLPAWFATARHFAFEPFLAIYQILA